MEPPGNGPPTGPRPTRGRVTTLPNRGRPPRAARRSSVSSLAACSLGRRVRLPKPGDDLESKPFPKTLTSLRIPQNPVWRERERKTDPPDDEFPLDAAGNDCNRVGLPNAEKRNLVPIRWSSELRNDSERQDREYRNETAPSPRAAARYPCFESRGVRDAAHRSFVRNGAECPRFREQSRQGAPVSGIVRLDDDIHLEPRREQPLTGRERSWQTATPASDGERQKNANSEILARAHKRPAGSAQSCRHGRATRTVYDNLDAASASAAARSSARRRRSPFSRAASAGQRYLAVRVSHHARHA